MRYERVGIIVACALVCTSLFRGEVSKKTGNSAIITQQPLTKEKADWFKRFIDLTTLAVISAGLYFAYDQAGRLKESIDANNKNINISTWATITTETSEIDKIFISSPDMQKYFYNSVNIKETDEDFSKASAIGTALLDYFDSVSSYTDYLDKRLPDTLIEKEAWHAYFASVFQSSPLLCRMYTKNAKSCGKSIASIAVVGCTPNDDGVSSTVASAGNATRCIYATGAAEGSPLSRCALFLPGLPVNRRKTGDETMRKFAPLALAALLLAGTAPAFAQNIPAGQTCGGLLCDMGVFGRKVPVGPNGEAPTPAAVAAAEASDPHRLPCNDFVCRAFGGKSAEAAAPPPPPPVAAAEEPMAAPKKAHKRKRVAKAETAAAAEPAAPK